MSCDYCGGTSLVQIDAFRVCTACGSEKKNPVYISGYGNPMTHKRLQYYSRIKRFRKTIVEMRSELLGKAMEPILNLYAFLEFMWNNKHDKTRKYFFATKVMLFFCLQQLGIDKVVPLLKNKDRNVKQLLALEALMQSNQMFTCLW